MTLNSTVLCTFGLAWLATSSLAQTNGCDDLAHKFFLEPIHLRLESQPEATAPAKTAGPVELSLKLQPQAAVTNSSRLDISWGDGSDLHSSVIRPGEFYLVGPEPLPEGKVVRALDRIFTPEVVRVGKVPISGSIVTAIKRKNPLCLLSPIIFQLSW